MTGVGVVQVKKRLFQARELGLTHVKDDLSVQREVVMAVVMLPRMACTSSRSDVDRFIVDPTSQVSIEVIV